MGHPILNKDKKQPRVLRDNKGRIVNKHGYLIDEDRNVID
jgi:hypothetical protein